MHFDVWAVPIAAFAVAIVAIVSGASVGSEQAEADGRAADGDGCPRNAR